MSRKERQRLLACSRVRDGQMSLREAAPACGLSYRQMRRVWQRYRSDGEDGLLHRGRGMPSNRSTPEATKAVVLARYVERYADFGPTLAAEKLQDEGFFLDHETLRRWLCEAGLWRAKARKHPYRSARPRRPRFGELVQLDGSFHDWLEGRGPRGCLMQMIDDATGVRLALMCEEETTFDAMRTLKRWIEAYGVPMSLYTDRKNVYVTDREPTLQEQLDGREPLTEFGRACEELGVSIVAARSPQAKGRVERAHKVLQDRFVKELRLEGVTTLDEADDLLSGGYIAGLNARFAQEPADPADAHRPLRCDEVLDEIFVRSETRCLCPDYTVHWHGELLQVLRAPRLPAPGSRLEIATWLDGTLHVSHNGRELAFQRLGPKPGPVRRLPQPSQPRRGESYARTPAEDHPWKRPFVQTPTLSGGTLAALSQSQANTYQDCGMGHF